MCSIYGKAGVSGQKFGKFVSADQALSIAVKDHCGARLASIEIYLDRRMQFLSYEHNKLKLQSSRKTISRSFPFNGRLKNCRNN